MRLREIFRFEFAYQVRRLTTWLYFAALVVVMLPVVIGNFAGSARDAGFLLNSPFVIAAATVFGTIVLRDADRHQ